MVEEQQKRVEEHTSKIVEEIDKSMRKMKVLWIFNIFRLYRETRAFGRFYC